jgi:hypothetical protein
MFFSSARDNNFRPSTEVKLIAQLISLEGPAGFPILGQEEQGGYFLSNALGAVPNYAVSAIISIFLALIGRIVA